MEIKGYEKFIELRRWFLKKLDDVDMRDGCKSYDGTFELLFSYPCYFDERDNGKIDSFDYVNIKLHCYVIGPYRHYEWHGKTIEEAVNNARKEIESWEN